LDTPVTGNPVDIAINEEFEGNLYMTINPVVSTSSRLRVESVGPPRVQEKGEK
jgi:hypothetical protein